MKKILANLVFCLIIGSPSTLIWAADESSDWYPIAEIYTLKDDSVLFKLSRTKAHPNPAGCSITSWLRAAPEQTNLEEMHQMAIAAQAAGKKVVVTIDGNECSGNYAKMISLSVED